jgi:hypothetical protein
LQRVGFQRDYHIRDQSWAARPAPYFVASR